MPDTPENERKREEIFTHVTRLDTASLKVDPRITIAQGVDCIKHLSEQQKREHIIATLHTNATPANSTSDVDAPNLRNKLGNNIRYTKWLRNVTGNVRVYDINAWDAKKKDNPYVPAVMTTVVGLNFMHEGGFELGYYAEPIPGSTEHTINRKKTVKNEVDGTVEGVGEAILHAYMKLFETWLNIQDEAGVTDLMVPFVGGGVYLAQLDDAGKASVRTWIHRALLSTINSHTYKHLRRIHYFPVVLDNNNKIHYSPEFTHNNYAGSVSNQTTQLIPHESDMFDSINALGQDKQIKVGILNPGSDRTMGGSAAVKAKGQNFGVMALEEQLYHRTTLPKMSMDHSPEMMKAAVETALKPKTPQKEKSEPQKIEAPPSEDENYELVQKDMTIHSTSGSANNCLINSIFGTKAENGAYKTSQDHAIRQFLFEVVRSLTPDELKKDTNVDLRRMMGIIGRSYQENLEEKDRTGFDQRIKEGHIALLKGMAEDIPPDLGTDEAVRDYANKVGDHFIDKNDPKRDVKINLYESFIILILKARKGGSTPVYATYYDTPSEIVTAEGPLSLGDVLIAFLGPEAIRENDDLVYFEAYRQTCGTDAHSTSRFLHTCDANLLAILGNDFIVNWRKRGDGAWHNLQPIFRPNPVVRKLLMTHLQKKNIKIHPDIAKRDNAKIEVVHMENSTDIHFSRMRPTDDAQKTKLSALNKKVDKLNQPEKKVKEKSEDEVEELEDEVDDKPKEKSVTPVKVRNPVLGKPITLERSDKVTSVPDPAQIQWTLAEQKKIYRNNINCLLYLMAQSDEQKKLAIDAIKIAKINSSHVFTQPGVASSNVQSYVNLGNIHADSLSKLLIENTRAYERIKGPDSQVAKEYRILRETTEENPEAHPLDSHKTNMFKQHAFVRAEQKSQFVFATEKQKLDKNAPTEKLALVHRKANLGNAAKHAPTHYLLKNLGDLADAAAWINDGLPKDQHILKAKNGKYFRLYLAPKPGSKHTYQMYKCEVDETRGEYKDTTTKYKVSLFDEKNWTTDIQKLFSAYNDHRNASASTPTKLFQAGFDIK